MRIALLQNHKLTEWQIYKALHNAIQRRGYDTNLAWANGNNDDDKENEKLSLKYTQDETGNELIRNEQYKYPCYYDALKLKLWNENEPDKFKKYVPLENVIKVRDSGIVAPRQMVEGIENPLEMDISEFVDKEEKRNPITDEEIRTMLSKIGQWDNLYIPDNRYEIAEQCCDKREKTDILIGNITNPIVRNRLQIFRDNLLNLKQKHGIPDEVIFEFVRDGADKSLLPSKKAQDTLMQLKKNEKENEKIAQELKDVDAYSLANFDKLKLLKIQNGKCVYSGEKIAISDFDKCEIDHIYPRTMGGNDALYNKVLCYSIENQKKKGRTPYEWLHNDEKQWFEYVNRLESIKDKLGKKKYQLLTSKPEDCEKLIESYNGLAETAQIARVAQQITAFVFGWGMQTVGDNRHIFVNNGSSTSAIRRRYGLNKLLGDDVKKNRNNDKHHALDAICISFSRDFKYDEKCKKDTIEGFTFEFVKEEIDKLMPYPYTNDKPFKGNTKPLETIYGYRKINDENCITQRISLENIEQKEKKIKTIVDEIIKNDLLCKLEEKMTHAQWGEMLKNYIHPQRQTRVKKVLTVVSTGELTKDSNEKNRIGEYADFGNKGVKSQFKHSKGHKGQIIYFNEKGNVKVMPIYANKKNQDVIDELQKMGCKLYKNGMMFYSGCLLQITKEFQGTVIYKIIIQKISKTKLIEKNKKIKEILPAGIYILRTIKSNGAVQLENQNGIEILTSATYLVQANFKKYQK